MGKSACAAVLRDAGVPVADADAAVHELYAPGGAAVEPVAAAFGREVLGGDGGVDRRALGALVVGNDAAMKTLEGVVHPLVAAHRERWLEERDAEGHEVVVLDVPLLYETRLDCAGVLDAVLVVSAPEAAQRERVLARPGMSAAKLDAILAKQMPDEEKRRRADVVIDTGCSMEDTKAALLTVLEEQRRIARQLMRFSAGLKVNGAATLAITWYTWACCLSILALTPADVQATLAKSSAGTHDAEAVLTSLWSGVYWSMFVLTWALLPFVQMYADSGAFSARARAQHALRTNAFFYAAVGGVGALGVVLLIASGELSVGGLAGVAMAASNAWGLLVALAALGYGMVEIPRSAWRNAGVSSRRRWAFVELDSCARSARGAAAELRAARGALGAVDVQMSRRDELRPYVNVVLEEDAEARARAQAQSRESSWACEVDEGDVEAAVEEGGAEDYDADVAGVAALRRRLRRARATVARWEDATARAARAARAADACAQEASGAAYGAGALSGSGVRRMWVCFVEPWVRRAGSVALAAASVATVLAEVTAASYTGLSSDLSAFSALVRSACGGEGTEDSDDGWLLAAYTLLPLLYVVVCTYYSLFKVRLFNHYSLTPGHSDAVSLTLNAALMARLAAPLAYNFLAVLHTPPYGSIGCPGAKREGAATAFSKTMHVMDRIPIFGGRDFVSYAPIVLVVVCALSLLNVGGCCGRLVGRFFSSSADEYADIDDDDGGDRMVALEERCRRLLQRHELSLGGDGGEASELLVGETGSADGRPLRGTREVGQQSRYGGGGGGGRYAGSAVRGGGGDRSWEEAKARLASRAASAGAGGEGRSAPGGGRDNLDGIFANLRSACAAAAARRGAGAARAQDAARAGCARRAARASRARRAACSARAEETEADTSSAIPTERPRESWLAASASASLSGLGPVALPRRATGNIWNRVRKAVAFSKGDAAEDKSALVKEVDTRSVVPTERPRESWLAASASASLSGLGPVALPRRATGNIWNRVRKAVSRPTKDERA
eukprot:PRCOL_00003268-RA